MSCSLRQTGFHIPQSLRALWQRFIESRTTHDLVHDDLSDADWDDEEADMEECQPTETCSSDPCSCEAMPAAPSETVGLLEAVFGSQWLSDEALRSECRALSEGVLAGNRPAAELVGQLFVFHAAPAERIAGVLKDLGDAYYRWRQQQPIAADAFAAPFIAWVNERAIAAGSANRVERAEPGERFDSHRHQSAGRGAVVAQAHGWVVLRTDGKVYSRAQVTVR